MWCVIWPVSWLSPTPLIVAGGAQPPGPVVRRRVRHLPETHMMAAIGAVADRLFEGHILLAALEQQGADRRIGIGPVEDHALADLQAGTPRDGVGGMPPGHGESMDQLGLRRR